MGSGDQFRAFSKLMELTFKREIKEGKGSVYFEYVNTPSKRQNLTRCLSVQMDFLGDVP